MAIKLLTNQTLMKDLRSELKELQKQMKQLKSNPSKLAKINSRFMETNMKYMTHSMRPTLFTFIPIILVFGWLNSHIGYYPIEPGVAFKLTATFQEDINSIAELRVPEGVQILDDPIKEVLHKETTWLLSAEEGNYELELFFNNETYTKPVIITDKREYAPVEKSFKKGFFSSSKSPLKKITLSNDKVQPFVEVPVIKDIPWVSTWSWLGAYILFSLVFSMTLRKVLKVY